MFTRGFTPLIRRTSRTLGTRTFMGTKVFQRFDKSVLYTTFLVVLLGSQILNVMNAQRDTEDLEKRYSIKMEKMDELKKRIQNGEKVDVTEEMKLVNKLFERTRSANINLRPVSDKLSSQVGISRNSSSEDLKDINLDEELSDEALNKLFSLDPQESKKLAKDAKKHEQSTKIVPLTAEEMQQQVKNEKELLKYRLDPNRHVVVESPGDYVSAAKDTKVSGFL